MSVFVTLFDDVISTFETARKLGNQSWLFLSRENGNLEGACMRFRGKTGLLVGVLKVDSIDSVSKFLIDNMGIFFAPGAVMILNKLEVISEIWWKLAIVMLVSFVISFISTYWAMKLTLYLQSKRKKSREAKEND